MLLQDHRVVDDSPFFCCYHPALMHWFKVSEVDVVAGGLKSVLTDVASNYPDVEVLLNCFELFQLLLEHLKFLIVVNWPILERHWFIKRATRAIEQHHQRLDEKAARTTKRIPKMELSSPIGSLQNPRLEQAGSRQRFFEHTPPHKWLVTMLVQRFVWGAEQDLSFIFHDIYHNFALGLWLILIMSFDQELLSQQVQALELLRIFEHNCVLVLGLFLLLQLFCFLFNQFLFGFSFLRQKLLLKSLEPKRLLEARGFSLIFSILFAQR